MGGYFQEPLFKWLTTNYFLPWLVGTPRDGKSVQILLLIKAETFPSGWCPHQPLKKVVATDPQIIEKLYIYSLMESNNRNSFLDLNEVYSLDFYHLGMKEFPTIPFGFQVLKGAWSNVPTTIFSRQVGTPATGEGVLLRRTQVGNFFRTSHLQDREAQVRFAKLAPGGGDTCHGMEKLPATFHGNHPAYNRFIMNEMNLLKQSGNLNLNSMQSLQHQMRLMVGDAYRSGVRLNQFFKP